MKKYWKILPAALVVLLAGLACYLWKPSPNNYTLGTERVLIPKTNLTIRIPAGFQHLAIDQMLLTEDIYDSTTLPSFMFNRIVVADSYRGIQATEDVLSRIFFPPFSDPQQLDVGLGEVYLSKYEGAESADALVAKALIMHEEKGITIVARDQTKMAEEAYGLLEAMLLSLEVEKTE